jgi:AraC family transcriptional regulator, regulatory protein of adaptative response / methylated-DNA-[protein]-cysteine methyltransferase
MNRTDVSKAALRCRYTTDRQRWRALLKRDRAAEGEFVYSVATTGIYCRPGCPSRLPNRDNVQFFDRCSDAERAGFRACRRCDPVGPTQKQRQVEAVARACKVVAASEELPSLSALASAARVSRYHFHRVFKNVIGLTPRQYAAGLRGHRVRSELRKRASVTDAIYRAGYGANSRFYENSPDILGMTPREYKSGGSGISIHYAIAPCALGLLLVAATKRGICAVALGETPAALERELRGRFPGASIQQGGRLLNGKVRAVVRRANNPATSAELPLDVRCTAFQERVYQALKEIPVGGTATYKEIAARIGAPAAVRAVAGACAANPIALLIPCHRVVRTNGEISGYRWGIKRKRLLLKQEQALKRKELSLPSKLS